ncbi:hypothetical protein [Leptospira meyeri]|uniref:hypothetical protein n=1 Tax=Leptospira meyeri TaxID=29508 RepID=UPI0002BFAD18|nr:hypothetical protein [Leptospira meyeri]EMJ90037.1 hypothetical protein LEP1GSC196_2834 [Leptospira meyeri serovar Semaranga str. Veldrot Semarang 173]
MIQVSEITWESFEKEYRKIGGFLFEDSSSEPGYTLCDWYFDLQEEVEILYAKTEPVAETIENNLSKLDDLREKGFYPCGAFFFELGYFFIEGLDLNHSPLPEGTPLLQYSIYKQKKESSIQIPHLPTLGKRN